jgi:hypothetical protein
LEVRRERIAAHTIPHDARGVHEYGDLTGCGSKLLKPSIIAKDAPQYVIGRQVLLV